MALDRNWDVDIFEFDLRMIGKMLFVPAIDGINKKEARILTKITEHFTFASVELVHLERQVGWRDR